MGTGIRAELTIRSPNACPVTRVASDIGTSSHTISKSVTPGPPSRVTEEFVLEGGGEAESTEVTEQFGDVDVENVFSYGPKSVYRFTRQQGWGCPCECVEQFDCPLVDVYTRNGALCLTFHVPDVDALQKIVRALRERYPDTELQRLLRSDEEWTDPELVFVDRSELTDRQLEVLRTAHEMGYFACPKESNAGDVADAVGIAPSTFTEHLSAAQRKLLSSILDA